MRFRTKGFTLVEIMVAMTIFSLIAVAVGACIISGIRIWDRVKNVNFTRANFLVDIDRLAGELIRSVDIAVIGFEGKKNEFSFPGVSKNIVARITYIYDPEKKVLLRRETKLEEILAKKTDKKYSETEFLQLEEFSVKYFGLDKENNIYVWTDTWSRMQGPFKAVKLEGKFKGEDFIKTIFVPVSG